MSRVPAPRIAEPDLPKLEKPHQTPREFVTDPNQIRLHHDSPGGYWELRHLLVWPWDMLCCGEPSKSYRKRKI